MPSGSFDRSRSITSSYFSLMPTTARPAPTSRMADGHPFDHAVDVLAEDLFVLVQQGLALGGVQQHGVGPRGELDVGRESGPAGPHHPRLGNVLDRDLRHGTVAWVSPTIAHRGILETIFSVSIAYSRPRICRNGAKNYRSQRRPSSPNTSK